MIFLRWLFRGFLLLGFFFLAGALLQFSWYFFHEETPIVRHQRDNFDPSLKRLDDLEKLAAFVDSIAFERGSSPDNQIEYANLADSVVRLRFYYGLQNYKFSDNFIANLAGKHIWSHFGAKVIPDDILKGQKAYCSQSSIVFQELLVKKGFDVRSVEFPHHFCTEVLIDGHWSFHDVSFKPEFKNGRSSTEELSRNIGLLEEAYLYSFRDDFFEKNKRFFLEGNYEYGKVNEFPASRMRWFHRITWFFSWFGWGVFFVLAWVTGRFARRK